MTGESSLDTRESKEQHLFLCFYKSTQVKISKSDKEFLLKQSQCLLRIWQHLKWIHWIRSTGGKRPSSLRMRSNQRVKKDRESFIHPTRTTLQTWLPCKNSQTICFHLSACTTFPEHVFRISIILQAFLPHLHNS